MVAGGGPLRVHLGGKGARGPLFVDEGDLRIAGGGVGLAQPSAVQASLYRLHFGNPEICPVAYIFQPYRLYFGNPEISPIGFYFLSFLPNYSMEC